MCSHTGADRMHWSFDETPLKCLRVYIGQCRPGHVKGDQESCVRCEAGEQIFWPPLYEPLDASHLPSESYHLQSRLVQLVFSQESMHRSKAPQLAKIAWPVYLDDLLRRYSFLCALSLSAQVHAESCDPLTQLTVDKHSSTRPYTNQENTNLK